MYLKFFQASLAYYLCVTKAIMGDEGQVKKVYMWLYNVQY